MQRGGTASRPKSKPKNPSSSKVPRQDSRPKSRPKSRPESLQKNESASNLHKNIEKRQTSGRKVTRQDSSKKLTGTTPKSPGARGAISMKRELEALLGKRQKGSGSSSKAIKTSVMKTILQQATHPPESKEKKAEIEDYVTQMPWPDEQLSLKEVSPLDNQHTYYVAQVVKSFMVEEGMLLAKQHLIQTLQYLQYLKMVKKPSDHEVAARRLHLPRRPEHKGRKTVVFDLDETLIHCSEQVKPDCDCVLPITFPSGETIEAGIYVRPHAKQVLRELAKEFQVMVFTASHSCYANQVINYLDPEGTVVTHRLFREHCYQTEIGLYIKDLRVLGRPLSELVLVDNAVYSYYFQMENGLPIVPYHQGKQDGELVHLCAYLRLLQGEKDVRPLNRATFRLEEHLNFDEPIALLSQLYPQTIQLLQGVV